MYVLNIISNTAFVEFQACGQGHRMENIDC